MEDGDHGNAWLRIARAGPANAAAIESEKDRVRSKRLRATEIPLQPRMAASGNGHPGMRGRDPRPCAGAAAAIRRW